MPFELANPESDALKPGLSRVCSHDDSGEKLREFATALEGVEPRYFTPLPGPAPPPMRARKGERKWKLPASKTQGQEEHQLLRAVFDLGRHGLAHVNQQTMVRAHDDRYFGVSWGGVTEGATLAKLDAERPPNHLSIDTDHESVLVVLSPGVLLLDLEQAVDESGVYRGDLPVVQFDRREKYSYTAAAAESKLLAGRHTWYEPPDRE